MSNLSQFLTSGIPGLGGSALYTTAIPTYLTSEYATTQANTVLTVNVGPYQYVRGGAVTPYESRHSSLLSLSKSFGVVTGVVGNKTTTQNYVYPSVVFTTNSASNNFHHISIAAPGSLGSYGVYSPYGNVRIFSTLSVSQSGANANLSTVVGAPAFISISDATMYSGNVLILSMYNDTGNTSYGAYVLSGNSNTYSKFPTNGSFFLSSVSNPWSYSHLVSNTTTVVAQNSYISNAATDAAISTNGFTSCTGRAYPAALSGKYVSRLYWSTLFSVWVLITYDGLIYTTPDLTTFTNRTSSISNMPTNITYFPSAVSLYAETASALYISVGYGKILKMSSLTSFSILDYGSEYATGYTTINMHYLMYYDGTRLVRTALTGGNSNAFSGYTPRGDRASIMWYSTDDAATWTRGFVAAPVVANNSANNNSTGNTGFNNYTVATSIWNVSKITPNSNIVMTYYGTMVANNGADGLIYISDMTGNVIQTNPDYVGALSTGVVGSGYIRTV